MAREGLREMDKASSTFDLHGFCLLVLCVIFSNLYADTVPFEVVHSFCGLSVDCIASHMHY